MDDVFPILQLRNNKAKDVCLDQGPLENHTAILYPCHGWGPQVGASLTRKRVNSAAHRGFVGLLLPSTWVVVTCSVGRVLVISL